MLDRTFFKTNTLKVKSAIRLFYFQNSLFRNVVNQVLWWTRPKKRPPVYHLITMREEDVMGPLQRDEALFLAGIIRVIRPKTVVEFGFHYGHSAFNFLQALSPNAQLFSYDISNESARFAQQYFRNYSNFHFLKKSQTSFSAEDIGGVKIDFAFIDGAHNFELNKITFNAILPSLAVNAIIAVHDTGTWNRKHFLEVHKIIAEDQPGNWLSRDEFQPLKDEREFVNWIGSTYLDFQTIHFHSSNCLRHGITLLQRKRVLQTSPS